LTFLIEAHILLQLKIFLWFIMHVWYFRVPVKCETKWNRIVHTGEIIWYILTLLILADKSEGDTLSYSPYRGDNLIYTIWYILTLLILADKSEGDKLSYSPYRGDNLEKNEKFNMACRLRGFIIFWLSKFRRV
jgi:hypothetical protein